MGSGAAARIPRLPRILRVALVALACASFLGLGHAAAAAPPDYFFYQVGLGAAPRNGDSALVTLDARATAFLEAMACGSELEFGRTAGQGSEGATALAIAKLEWAAGHPNSQGAPRVAETCRFSRVVLPAEVCPYFVTGNCWEDATLRAAFIASGEWQGLRRGDFTALNDRLKSVAAPFCTRVPGRDPGIDGVIWRSAPNDPSNPLDEAVRIDFAVDRACLVGQVNKSLALMQIEGQLGTAGAPCNLRGLLWGDGTTGDWDMTVKNLTRIVYLDERYGNALLTPLVRDHVQRDLLSADGGPAEESYPLTGCGNTQESTGSSQDRADEREWIDDVGGFLEDVWRWLWKLLVIVFVALAVAALVAAALGAGAAATWVAVGAGVAAGAATAIAVSTVVPETENHLLMINTSKYLKNQFIIRDLGPGSDRARRYEQDQIALRSWLLGRMQGFLRRDFVEYNSRPYQRLSIVAILNVADFAHDDDLRTGAQLVLDYTTAKFAVGSLQGRRFLPMRRLRETLRDYVDVAAPKTAGLFDLVQGGDHQVALGLLYNGQTQQLRGARASFGAAAQAVYATTSSYHPEAFVMDLAIRKDSAPVFQRLHHTTGEVYAGGRGYLISAGGTATGQAYSGSGFEGLDQAIQPKLKNDEGLALPTTLLLAGPPTIAPGGTSDRTTLVEQIRIDGQRPNDARFPSYDHNLCVWDGFACGTNVVVPNEFFEPAPPGTMPCTSRVLAKNGATWDFIDTARCTAYKDGPRVFVAVYRHPCPGGADDCADNFGFFEVVDATAADVFPLFTQKVLAANPQGFVGASGTTGTYTSVRGYVIAFDANGHQHDDDATGIVSIYGAAQGTFGDWPFAGGDVRSSAAAPIESAGDGLVVLWNPRLGVRMDLDFRDANHPVRRLR